MGRKLEVLTSHFYQRCTLCLPWAAVAHISSVRGWLSLWKLTANRVEPCSTSRTGEDASGQQQVAVLLSYHTPPQHRRVHPHAHHSGTSEGICVMANQRVKPFADGLNKTWRNYSFGHGLQMVWGELDFSPLRQERGIRHSRYYPFSH